MPRWVKVGAMLVGALVLLVLGLLLIAGHEGGPGRHGPERPAPGARSPGGDHEVSTAPSAGTRERAVTVGLHLAAEHGAIAIGRFVFGGPRTGVAWSMLGYRGAARKLALVVTAPDGPDGRTSRSSAHG